MVDTHRYLGNVFNPTQNDVDSYLRVVDVNRRNVITRQDFESLVIRTLCGGS